MLIKLVLLILMGWTVLADAATYYVRPLGGSYGTENGTSYVDAFDGFAGISGLAAGDTLYICGAHTEAFTTPISGTSVAQMIADGRCPGDAGSMDIGAGARNIILNDGVGEDFWTFRYLTIAGGTGAGTALYCNGVTDCNGIIFEYNTVTCTNAAASTQAIRVRSPKNILIQHNDVNGTMGNCGTGIFLDTSSAPLSTHINNHIENNVVYGFGGVCIRIQGVSQANPNPGPNYVRDNDTHDCGDGIYHVNADQITNSGNLSYGNNRTGVGYGGEGYGFASTWSDLNVWEDNIAYLNRSKAIEPYSDNLRVMTGVTIRRNDFYDNATELIAYRCTIDVNNGSPGDAVWTGVTVSGNIVKGGSCGISLAPGVVGAVVNNTIVAPLLESGIYIEANADNLTLANNLCLTMGGLPCIRMSDSGVGANITVDSNLYDPTGTTNLARKASTNYTSGTIATFDSGAVVAAPLLSATYSPSSSSPARRAGVPTAFCIDYRGRVCPPDSPNIGAYQSTSGDPAATRAVRN